MQGFVVVVVVPLFFILPININETEPPDPQGILSPEFLPQMQCGLFFSFYGCKREVQLPLCLYEHIVT